MKEPFDPIIEFSRRVREDSQSGCWIWTGLISIAGYGEFQIPRSIRREIHALASFTDDPESRKLVRAHRFAYYVLCNRKARPNTQLHHRCRNPLCVNPAHLVELDAQEHSDQHQETHCKHGHEFTPENTLVSGNVKRQRHCRICLRARYDALTPEQKEKRRINSRRWHHEVFKLRVKV